MHDPLRMYIKFSKYCYFHLMDKQVERGFNITKQFLVENLHPSSPATQRIFYDHMIFHKLKTHENEVNAKMFSHIQQVAMSMARQIFFKKVVI